MKKIKTNRGFEEIEHGKHQVVIGITGSVGDGVPQKEWLPAYVVERDGTVLNLYKDSYTTHILGDGALEDMAIHIELANAGPVALKDGTGYAMKMIDGKMKVTDEAVAFFYEFCSHSPYNGNIYYEYITPKQIEALRELVMKLIKKYKIEYKYDNQCGDICPRALNGCSGVFLLSAYSNKSKEPHPQPELIRALKAL